MRIEIKTEKVHTINGQGRKILAVDCLPMNKLPLKYRGNPYCWLEDGAIRIDTGNTTWVRPDRIFEEENFQTILEIIRQCGRRLSEIKARIRAELAEWQGEETFVI